MNPRTIVIINSGGGVAWTNWLERVPAVLEAWYSGQESGRAVAEILFGDVNPSGKLPATFEKKWEDNPSSPYYHIKQDGKTPYKEGIFVGYRGYDQNKVEPQFCFGHGLSYTTFTYGSARVTPGVISTDAQAIISLEVSNTGKRAGDEVVQLYVHPRKSSVPMPPKELHAFQRVSLQPGEKKIVNLVLPVERLAYYDVNTHGFIVEPGKYDIMIGASSRDIRAKTGLTVGGGE